ncbi:MAG: thioredoxin [Propionibacterium sp.]|nr:thioredoxin [Propionibacterium sp.]
MAEVIDVTDATFAEVVLQSSKPVLVDYWADWCAPCKQIAPIIAELAAEHGDKMTFAKMDVNANQQIPTQYQVLNLPTLHVFRGGEVVDQIAGARSKMALQKAIDPYL